MRRHIHSYPENETESETESETALCAILPYLGWMRLWLSCLTENLTENLTTRFERGFGYLLAFEKRALQEAADIACGKTRAPALIPESARAAEAPKISLNRRAERILRRGLPASRQYEWFRYASPRTLTGNQFFELVAKLSVNGRIGVYRLEYKTRLCKRRPENILKSVWPPRQSLPANVRENDSLSAAHLWPG